MTIWTAAFWKATAERALSTVAQAAIATIGTTAALHEVDWIMVASVAALAGLLSVLKAVGAGLATGVPSIGHAEDLAGARYLDADGDGRPDVAP